jgi:hypothetical protein
MVAKIASATKIKAIPPSARVVEERRSRWVNAGTGKKNTPQKDLFITPEVIRGSIAQPA